MSVADMIAWLAATPMSETIKVHEWIVPTIQTAHILAISVLMGSVLIIDLRLFGMAGRSQSLGHIARRYLPWFWGAFTVLLASGTLMVIGEPARELQNPSFWLKMKLLLVALLATALFNIALWRERDRFDERSRSRSIAAAGAMLTLLLWIAVIFAGRFIAYTIEY